MNIKILFGYVLFFVSLSLHGQELLPFVENFTKSEYSGDNQNWNIEQGNDNAIYFANNRFFLRYNGVKWEKYTLPNSTVIRSIFVDGDRIYCGSYKEFGFWKRIAGKMQYFSLTADLDLFTGTSDNEEIWKVFKHQGAIYFQSFNELYIYREKKIEKIRFPFQISYCYVIDDQIYAASVRQGIYRLDNRKFIRLQNWAAVDNEVVHHIEKHDNSTYIFTKNNGVFREINGVLKPWANPLNDQLKNETILSAKFLKDKVAIGTGLQGLYVIDLKSGQIININREKGVRNNAILSLATDQDGDLWLGLDNGIAHVEMDDTVRLFTDNSGILGSVYAISITDDGYLFGTNHGLSTYSDKKLSAVNGSQGQVWDIFKTASAFVIGHNDGTYIYKENRLSKANDISGGWKMLQSDFDESYFQAHYSGIAIYQDGEFSKPVSLQKLTKPIRNIAQNKHGELWAADNYRSLYRLTYDANYKAETIENISQQNKIVKDYGAKIFQYRDEVLFLINKVWYTYDSVAKKLVKDALFNNYFANISDIIPIDDNRFMIERSGLLYLIRHEKDAFVWELIPEKYYEGRLIIDNTKVTLHENALLINLDDGFLYLSPSDHSPKIGNIIVEGFYEGKLIMADSQIKYNQPVEINVISGHYGYHNLDFYYKKEGGEDYIRIENGQAVLNNLNSGNQLIKIYYFNGKDYIEIADYEFTVENPWYFSVWMIVLYIVLIALSFFLYYRWNKVKYSQKLKLREEELKHQKEILEIALKTQNELNIQQYEKHILELEVQSKSSEVAGKSLSIAKQNEMIENIRKILETETDINILKSQITKAIKINAVNMHEWEAFESNLNQLNNEFINEITKRFPNLTSKDIKLCIFLKMNLSSKEIAPMMNISFRGVELHRYRLRKKLGLTSDESLTTFMFSIFPDKIA